MNRDLFLAILSMDSYNRGYGRAVNFGPNSSAANRNEIGVQIGLATVVSQDNSESAIAAGFYTLAYDVSGAGVSGLSGTVISYRGTDFDLGESATEFFSSPFVADALSGWGVGVGLLGSQAGLAVQFYRSVIGLR